MEAWKRLKPCVLNKMYKKMAVLDKDAQILQNKRLTIPRRMRVNISDLRSSLYDLNKELRFLQCDRCEHIWIPIKNIDVEGLPKKCPKCQNSNWNTNPLPYPKKSVAKKLYFLDKKDLIHQQKKI